MVSNTANFSPEIPDGKMYVDDDTLQVDDIMLEVFPARAYWPMKNSPVLNRAKSRNGSLSVKVYSDLKGQPLRKGSYAVGCYQRERNGLMILFQSKLR